MKNHDSKGPLALMVLAILVMLLTGCAREFSVRKTGPTPEIPPSANVLTATRLLLSGPATTVAGTCAGPFQVEAVDDDEIPRPLTEAAAVTISNLGTANIFSDSNCSQLAAPLMINANSDTRNFFIRDTAYNRDALPINLSLRAHSPALLSSAALAISKTYGAAARLVYSVQPSSTTVAAVSLATQPEIKVLDAVGNTVRNFSGQVTLLPMSDSNCTTPAAGTLSGASVSANAGLADFLTINHSQSGTIYLRATAGALTSACSTAIAVSSPPPPPATQLTFSVQPSNSVIELTELATQPVVRALDANGNLATSFTGQISLRAMSDSTCTTPHGGVLSGAPIAAQAGVADFSVVRYSQPGVIYLQATATGLTPACSSAITVNPTPPAMYRLNVTLSGTGTGVVQSGRSNPGNNLTCRSVDPAGTNICSVEAPAGTKFTVRGFNDTGSFLAGYSGLTCTYDPAVANDIKYCTFELNFDVDIDVVFRAQSVPFGSQGLASITAITATVLSPTSALIQWTTRTAADTTVRYGLTATHNTHSSLIPELTLNHSVTLTDLTPNTTYSYKVLSRDITGLLAGSATFTFATPAP